MYLCAGCQDATELGAVFIGTESHSYSVSEGNGRGSRGGRWHCGITLKTPHRDYVFMCEQEQERKEWLEAFRKVISQPMTPEDYASKMLVCCHCLPVFLAREYPLLTCTLFLWYRRGQLEQREMTAAVLPVGLQMMRDVTNWKTLLQKMLLNLQKMETNSLLYWRNCSNTLHREYLCLQLGEFIQSQPGCCWSLHLLHCCGHSGTTSKNSYTGTKYCIYCKNMVKIRGYNFMYNLELFCTCFVFYVSFFFNLHILNRLGSCFSLQLIFHFSCV